MAPLAPSAQQSPKAGHYRANLGAALVRGAWTVDSPGLEPNGTALSWSELIRKWGKHTGGNTSLVAHLRTVSLLDLSSSYHIPTSNAQIGSSASSGDAVSHDTVASGSASSYVNVGGGTSTNGAALTSSPSSNLRSGYVTVGDQDGEDGAGGSSWAVGSHWGWSLDDKHSEELRDGVRQLESMLSGKTLAAHEQPSALLTLAYHHHALGDHDVALATYDRFNWAAPSVGAVEGDAAIVERIRARTFQGICHELCSQPNSTRALECYLAAVQLIDSLSFSPLTTPAYLLPPNAQRPPSPNFEAQREVLRHVSTSLTRAAVISARTSDTHYTLRILRTYHALAPNWPGGFRAHQRQRMLSLYLAALQSSYPASGATALEPYLLVKSGTSARSGRATWRAEVTDTLRNGRRMLGDTTSFPRAGNTNEAVTEFATQTAAFPEHSPSLASDAISTLWWTTNLTFQSHSTLRHLVLLLCTSGDRTEARRSFELYVQLVLQHRQTQDPENPLTLQDRCTEDFVEEVNGITPDDVHTVPEEDGETDEEFVTVLLAGTRLLASTFNDPEEAWRYATLAGNVAQKHRLSPTINAKVEACRGSVRLSMATSVAGPDNRAKYLKQAISHLTSATVIDPGCAEGYYDLSYAYATAREIQPAVNAVRSTLEADSQNVKAWHLLALLLTAQGDWESATKAGETGVALWEADDEAIAADEADAPLESPAPAHHTLLLPTGELSPPVPAAPVPQSKTRRLETVIQLRMTLNIIAEKLYGPEVALERHQQLFLFFSQRTDRAERPRSGTMSTDVRSSAASVFSSAQTMTTTAAANPDLGGSYVITPTSGEQQPHTIAGVASTATGALSPPVIHTPSSTADSSNPGSDVETPPERRVHITVGGKKLFPKHLHVPSVARSPRSALRASSAPSALRGGLGGRSDTSLTRTRTASTSTIALSIAPTAVHSHFHGAHTMLPRPPSPSKTRGTRTSSELRILSDLWLMSAASFRRAGKHGQCLVAIEEAETQDPENPAVWVQLGLLYQAERGATNATVAAGDARSDALSAYTKALLLRTDYPPAVVSLGRLYLEAGEVDLAHSLLWQLTQDKGWDVPEAWYTLANACEKQGRSPRARECLMSALDLQKTRTCRALDDALSRL